MESNFRKEYSVAATSPVETLTAVSERPFRE